MDLQLLKKLDYTLFSNKERADHVTELLAEYETLNGPIDLESAAVATQIEGMANFILYGKDEETGKSDTDTKKVKIPTKYSSFKRKEPESLEQLQESPTFNEHEIKPYNQRNIYTKPRNTISRVKDGDIPYIRQLWEAIDELQLVYDYSTGKLPAQESGTPMEPAQFASFSLSTPQEQNCSPENIVGMYYINDELELEHPEPTTLREISPDEFFSPVKQVSGLSLYKLRHWLIDLKRQQYLLRDSHYIQQNVFNTTQGHYQPDYIDWDSEKYKLDFTNPEHIYHLLEWYSAVNMAVYDDLNNPTKYLYWYLEDIIYETDLSPARMLILTMKVDKQHNYRIVQELKLQFGIEYTENYISTIWKQEICGKIAKMAELVEDRFAARNDLSKWKRCTCCGYLKLRDSREFVKKNTNKDGLSNRCKSCDKQLRDLQKRSKH